MDIEFVASKLVGTKPCEDLNEAEARRLVELGSTREVAAGEVIVAEGDAGDEAFVLLEGTTEYFKKDPRQRDVRIGGDSAPVVLGEIALVRPGPRMATARAQTACKFFVLGREVFQHLIDTGDPIAYKISLKIARTLADRIAWVNEELLELLAQQRPDELDDFAVQLRLQWNF